MIWFWIAFLALVIALLAVDLGVVGKKAVVPTITGALLWTAFYVCFALAFNVVVYFVYEHHWFGAGAVSAIGGREAAIQFFTGWLLEKTLSLDNVFVIALIFAYFRIPPAFQHRVLTWGILGALIMRGVLIGAGAAMMARFHWTAYLFGALLILTAVKMLVARHDNLEPDKNPIVRLARRVYPVTGLHGADFFVVENGRRAMTPLFLTMLVVESSDLLFAIDSIPAVLAVTSDPFLVYTSNIFAVLGLRALYFVLAGFMARFRYLKMSLVFLLAYVGVKMMLTHHSPIPNPVSLAIIAGILSVGVIASLVAGDRDTAPLRSPLLDEIEQMRRVTLRQARRVVIFVVGVTLLALGAVMLLAPGPGLLVILGGLGLLGIEFAWARRWLKATKKKAREVENALRRKANLPER